MLICMIQYTWRGSKLLVERVVERQRDERRGMVRVIVFKRRCGAARGFGEVVKVEGRVILLTLVERSCRVCVE